MATSVMLPNFNAGEISQNLYARVDLEKYRSGAQLLRNFFVDYRGGVSNRPGTKFIAHAAQVTNVRLLPFVFSRDYSYILELSDHELRIFFRGTLVQTILGTPWAGPDIAALKYSQSADVMTVVHPSYPPYNINRIDLTPTFTVTQVNFGATISAPAQPTLVPSSTAAPLMAYVYCITAIDKDGQESVASPASVCGSPVLDPTAAIPATIGIQWPQVTGAEAYNVYKAGPVGAHDPMPTVYGYIGQCAVCQFTDNNIGPDFSHVAPQHRDPFSPGQITSIGVTSGGTGALNLFDPLVISDSSGGSGGAAYFVAQAPTFLAIGTVVTQGGINYTQSTTTAIPTSGTGTFQVFVDSNNYYPSCVAYFQQRRYYAGSAAAPLRIDASKPGEYDNFDISPAVVDSDAMTMTLSAQQVNCIQHMVPMSMGLVVFTTGNAFLLSGGGGYGTAVTPTNILVNPQASTGANELPPIVVNYNILFAQYEGVVVRDMQWQWTTNSYFGTDRSMLASHLFTGYQLMEWGFAMEPYHLLNVVRNDGQMLVMTYVPEQEVFGWAHWDTQGLFMSVAVVPEDERSATYVVVKRFIQGNWVQYIERFADREDCCILEDWFLDCAVSAPIAYPNNTLLLSGTTGNITLTLD